MHASTVSRRVPLGAWKLDSGISALFQDSPSLWPMNWRGEGWEHASVVSRLHLRGMEILRNDPEVIAVTVLEHDEFCGLCLNTGLDHRGRYCPDCNRRPKD